MASVRVSRDSGYADCLRTYAVILDGKRIDCLRAGSTKQFPVPPGEHKLRVRIDWCESNTVRFTVAEDETAVFRIKSNLRGWRVLLAPWYAIFAWNSYLHLVRMNIVVGDAFLDPSRYGLGNENG